MPITTSKGHVIDTTLDQETIARLIWEEGLSGQQAYTDLKQALPFDHLAILVAGDLDRAKLLTQGSSLDYDDYHPEPWAPHANFNALIQGNQSLFKIISDWRGYGFGVGGFLQQLTDFSVRPALRNGKNTWATHKLDLRTNQIIPYLGKRRPKTGYDKTKKQSATFLSKHLNTGVFMQGVGLLFDENECDIRAMFKTNALTVQRGWVGSLSTVQSYKANMASQLMTDRTAFRNYVDSGAGGASHNEVLAKLSIKSILGVFIVGDTQFNRSEARKRQQDLKKHFHIDYPIFIYDNNARTIRIYTQQEQVDDVAGYNKIARENQTITTSITPACNAIRAGDLKLLKQLFQKQPSLIKKSPWIFQAIDSKKPDILNYLLTLPSINLEQKNTLRQETALVYATRLGYAQMVEALLLHGANIDSQDADGQTALMYSMVSDDTQFLKLLLKQYPRPDGSLLDNNGDSALTLALKNFRQDMLEMLLDNGYNQDQLDGNQQTLLHIAALYGFSDFVTCLLTYNADINIVDANGDTPIMIAARENNSEIVKLLLAEGADLSITNLAGESALSIVMDQGFDDILALVFNQDSEKALILVAGLGDEKLTRLVLDKPSVDIDYADEHGETALMHAVKNGFLTIAGLLLDKRSNVEKTNFAHQTPLILATQATNTAMIALLLGKKANINHADINGDTALMHAVRQGDLDAVILLLNHTPALDITLPNKRSETAFLLAVQGQHTLIVGEFLKHYPALLHQHIAPDQTGLRIAARLGDSAMVHMFLSCGADPLSVDGEENNALMIAAKHGQLAVVKELIPFIPDARDLGWENKQSETAFVLAIVHQHEDIVNELTSHDGSLVNSINAQGQTPLMIASKQANGVAIVDFLLNNGALPTAMDVNDEHALMHAAHGGDLAIVKHLLAHGGYNLRDKNKSSQTVMDIAIDEQPDLLEALLLNAAGLKDERELVLDKHSNQDLKDIFLDLFENDELDGMMAFLLLDIYKMIHRFDPQHVDAIAAAMTLHASLKQSFHDYRQTGRNKDDRNDLFNNWRVAIDDAKKSELSHHRHWSKNLLAHLSLFILTLGVGYLGVGLATLYRTGGKRFFFSTNTTSLNMLNTVEYDLDRAQQTLRGA